MILLGLGCQGPGILLGAEHGPGLDLKKRIRGGSSPASTLTEAATTTYTSRGGDFVRLHASLGSHLIAELLRIC